MREEVIKYKPESEFFIDEGCFIIEHLSEPGEKGISIARARVEVGVQTKWHRLNGVVERYVLLDGRGLVEVGDLSPQEVGAGDVVVIPEGVRQRIKNVGDSDLIFLCICSPRFQSECYQELTE